MAHFKKGRSIICGIVGYIGESTNPDLTYQITTKLFAKSEIRGIDAAGFWGTEKGIDGSVIYHKEPVRSSFFVQKQTWKDLKNHNLNLLLLHARGASKGMGDPIINKNNHPFTSLDKSVALIHNGKIDDNEYKYLKLKYNTLSQCDSEIILRIFEAAELYSESFSEEEYPHRLAGIRDIFSHINLGHMAVAIGERKENDDRLLWLFRNKHRPLWLIDARETLGQIFFVSDVSIWEETISEFPDFKSEKFIQLPQDEAWQFKVSSLQSIPNHVKRYVIKKNKNHGWQFDGNKINPIRKDLKFNIISKLDDNDKITNAEDSDNQIFKLHQKCNNIIETINDIRFNFKSMMQQNSMSEDDIKQLLFYLDEYTLQLQNINNIS